MNKRNKVIIVLLVVLFIVTLTNCKKDKHSYQYASKYYFYLDTTNLIKVEYDEEKMSESEVNQILDSVDEMLFNIEKSFSSGVTIMMKNEDILTSEVMDVNKEAGIKPVKVSLEFINLLKLAINIALSTKGGFDPTIGALTSLWNISELTEYCKPESLMYDESQCCIPLDEEIKETLTTVNYKDIVINEAEQTVFLKNKGTKLDFGGIAKGYASDIIMDYLKTKGFEYISVWLGGNLMVHGVSQSYAKENKIVNNSIENPFNNSTILSTPITDVSIVSSGKHERYIEVKGVAYHHLLSTSTGYPIDNELALVSIIGESSAICDGLSTGVFALGKEEGINYLKNSAYMAVIVTTNKEIYIIGDIPYTLTEGVSEEFTIINITKE